MQGAATGERVDLRTVLAGWWAAKASRTPYLLTMILALSLWAVLAGARWFVAIADRVSPSRRLCRGPGLPGPVTAGHYDRSGNACVVEPTDGGMSRG